MDDKLKYINTELVDGYIYWVRYDENWNVARYVEKYKQFQFIGRTVYDLSNILEIDYNPIFRKTYINLKQ